MSAAAGPNLDTAAEPGVEARGQVGWALGGQTGRFFAAVAGGGGYLEGARSGYGVVSPEIGAEFGRSIQVRTGVLYAYRGFADYGRSSGGGGVEVVFPVHEQYEGMPNLLLGPRLQAEGTQGLRGENDRGIFTLSFTMRWIAFDSKWFD